MTPSDPDPFTGCPEPAGSAPKNKPTTLASPRATGKSKLQPKTGRISTPAPAPPRAGAGSARCALRESLRSPPRAPHRHPPTQPRLSPHPPALPSSPEPQPPGLPGRSGRCFPGLQASRVQNCPCWPRLGWGSAPRPDAPSWWGGASGHRRGTLGPAPGPAPGPACVRLGVPANC